MVSCYKAALCFELPLAHVFAESDSVRVTHSHEAPFHKPSISHRASAQEYISYLTAIQSGRILITHSTIIPPCIEMLQVGRNLLQIELTIAALYYFFILSLPFIPPNFPDVFFLFHAQISEIDGPMDSGQHSNVEGHDTICSHYENAAEVFHLTK